MQAPLTGFVLLLPLVAYMRSGMKIALFNRYPIPDFAHLDRSQWLIGEYFDTLVIRFTEPFGRMHRDWGPDILLPLLLSMHSSAALHHHWTLRDN